MRSTLLNFVGRGALRASNDRFRRPEEDLSDGGGMERRFFSGSQRNVHAAEVSITSDALEIGARRPLFGPLVLGGRVPFDASTDGQRFLIVIPTREHTVEPLTVVETWPALLKK
jgi:hypothetical protein